MTDSAKFTHTVWAGAKQPDWPGTENPPDQDGERLLDAGQGWIDKDNVAHLRIDSMPIEDTFTCRLYRPTQPDWRHRGKRSCLSPARPPRTALALAWRRGASSAAASENVNVLCRMVIELTL
jgi:hypothetical protein